MSVNHWQFFTNVFFLICLTLADLSAGNVQASIAKAVGGQKSTTSELITVGELKSKMSKQEPVTIIDVRSSASYAASDVQIKGAIRVRLRRLKARLAVAPLKDVPRKAEIITYCDCTGDESSKRAAELLLAAGFERVRVLKGGWQEWQKMGGQVEPRPKAPYMPVSPVNSEP